MQLKFIFLFLSILIIVRFANAQTDTISRFYQYNTEVVFDRIEREHIPLDGKKVEMIPFRKDNLFGFVGKENPDNWLIKPEFDQVFAVSENGAIVKKGQGYGLVNASGNWIISPYYENLIPELELYHGLIAGVIDTSLPEAYQSFIFNQYFDKNGKLLFSEKAHDQQSFSGKDTLAWFRYGTRFHVYGKSGKLHRTFSFSEEKHLIGICDNKLIFSEKIAETHYYSADDLSGKPVFRIPVEDEFMKGICRLSANLYGLIGNDAEYYFCDSLGKPKSYGVFTDAVGFYQSDLRYFDQSIFIVSDRNSSRQGVINRDEEILVPFEFRYIGSFCDGRAFAVSEKGNYLFIDTNGRILMDVSHVLSDKGLEHSVRRLQEPLRFADGWCLGQDYILLHGDTTRGESPNYIDMDSLYFYYFNMEGRKTLELPGSFRFAGYFSEGLAPAVNSEGDLGFIDTSGKWAIPPEYELTMAGGYPIPYLVVPEFIGGYAYIKAFKGYIDKKGRPYFSGKRMEDHYNFSH